MDIKRIFILVSLAAALSSAIVVSFLVTSNNILLLSTVKLKNTYTTAISQEPYYDSNNNKIQDRRADTKLISLYKTNIVPKIRDYHDILFTEVNSVNDDNGNKNLVMFTIGLDGDANQNENYETVYLWFINYTKAFSSREQQQKQQQQFYTIIIPNFAQGSKFEGNSHGWYLAIFNNTNNSYSLPLSKISDMPKNKVQIFIDPEFIGNPISDFSYFVSAMIRVNSTSLDKPPGYLVDSAPDNDNRLFWIKWLRG